MALSVESRRSALASLEQSLQRMQGQLAQLESRRSEIAAQLASGSNPVDDLETERQTYLNQRLLVDRQLVEARQALAGTGHANCAGSNRNAIASSRRSDEQREEIARMRLAEQEHRLRAQRSAMRSPKPDSSSTKSSARAGRGRSRRNGRASSPSSSRRSAASSRSISPRSRNSTSSRSARPISTRSSTDLTTALETLEGAIRKIDKETRARFKETFDRVNTGIQELFPRLFGGGHAYLELTGDDLLSTGVSIMARPPGKRVTRFRCCPAARRR